MKVNYMCVICLQPKEAHPVYTTGVQCSAYTPPIGTAMVKTDWQPDLKPCPFCGGEAMPRRPDNWYVEGDLDSWTVICSGCSASVVVATGVESVVSAWNTRAEPEPDWTIPLKRHVPEIKAELKSCDGCDTDDYDIHTCGKGTRAEPVPPPCKRCGKPEILLGDYCQGCWEVEMERGQRALELARDMVADRDFFLCAAAYLKRAKALLEASDEQHPKP